MADARTGETLPRTAGLRLVPRLVATMVVPLFVLAWLSWLILHAVVQTGPAASAPASWSWPRLPASQPEAGSAPASAEQGRG